MKEHARAIRWFGWPYNSFAEKKASPTGGKVAAVVVAWMASVLVLAAPFSNFLDFQQYPLLTPEIGVVSLGILGLCFLIALVHQGVRPRVQALFEGLLVALAVDLSGAPFTYAAFAAAAVAIFGLVKGRSSLRFLGTMALVTIAVGFLGIGREDKAIGSPTAAATSSAAPALLHIILDEHIGIEGLATDDPAAKAMKRDLKAFYLSRGFALFGRAYSEHMHTVNAVPHMMNLGALQRPTPSPKDGIALAENAYFERLAELGYSVNVYQSDFIDYCSASSVSACHQYAFGGLRPLSTSPLSAADKAGLIAVKFALLSRMATAGGVMYLVLRKRLNKNGYSLPDLGLSLQGRASSINALAAFDTLIDDLHRARPGEAYFAHILLPHDPYATDPQCRLRETERWLLSRSAASLRKREAAYFDQLRCVMRKVDDALQAISASPAGGNYIAVLHGDHGSRITTIEPTADRAGEIGDRDLIRAHSTLFAVRGTGLAPGYREASVSVSSLLSHWARSGFTTLPKLGEDASPGTVVLADKDWMPRRRTALPASW